MSPPDALGDLRPNAPPVAADLLALALSAIAAAAPEALDLPAAVSSGGLAAALRTLRSRPDGTDLALVALADALALDDAELVTVALAAATETDPALCRTLAAVQAPIGGPRPLLGLIATALAPLQPPAATLLALVQGEALRSGLLRLDAADAPLPERSVAVHLPTIAALSGYASDWERIRLLPASPAMVLAAADHAKAVEWGAVLGEAPGRGLLIRAADPEEARALAQLIAAAMRRRAAWVEGPPPPGLAPWLIAAGAVPVFACPLRPGEEQTLPSMRPYAGPVLAVCGADGAVRLPGTVPAQWLVAPPDVAARASLWRAGGVAPDAAQRAAGLFRQGAGRIAGLAAGALLAARGTAPGWPELRATLMAQGAPGLEALTMREPPPIGGVTLVAPPALQRSLAHLLDRCRLREHLAAALGPAAKARHSPGVRALFHGPSGTGKSLAAHWLAAELGMPLHRVDLAALTSKWIGETEKNLSDLLGAAEHADVVLLFDEADALFGARTEISDAHDRYANAQTNYLLQRMEVFSGIAVMTCNGRDRFDAAFTRRLDAILEFPLPDPPARRALWAAHLGEPGEAHALDDAALDRLALACDLAGGHVRNIVLAAMVTAQSQGRPIALDDIGAAAGTEYGKLGRPPPSGLARG